MIKNPETKNERSEDLNENNLGVVQSGRILALGYCSLNNNASSTRLNLYAVLL